MNKTRLIRKATRILKEIESKSSLYNELDQVTEDLRRSGFRQSKNLVLVDNFKRKNAVFRTTSVRRFELRLND